MDAQPVLAPALFTRIIEQIDVARWGAATSMFALCWEMFVLDEVPPDQGVKIPADRAGRMIGAGFAGTANTARGAGVRALRRLVDDGVLEVGLDAAGSRAHAYVFVHEIGRWVGVPWRQKDPATGRPIEAWQAKAIIEGHLRPVSTAKTAFVARHSARLGPLSARSGARQTEPERAPGRATSDDRSARHSARLGAEPPPAPSFASQLENPPPTPKDPDAHIDGLASAKGRRIELHILKLCSQRLKSPAWRERLARSLHREGVDLDQIEDAMTREGGGLGPPALCSLAIAVADGQVAELENGDQAADRERRQRLARLRNTLASYNAEVALLRDLARAAGEEFEMPDTLARKRAECQNDIAALEGQDGADGEAEAV